MSDTGTHQIVLMKDELNFILEILEEDESWFNRLPYPPYPKGLIEVLTPDYIKERLKEPTERICIPF